MASTPEPQQVLQPPSEDHTQLPESIQANGAPALPTAQANGQLPNPAASATSEIPSPEVRKTPFTHPSPKSTIPPKPTLTPEQNTKYTSLLTTASSWTVIPTTSAPTSPITPAEKLWLTRECLLRYLRASKWDVTAASTRLLSTLTWRREYGLLSFTADYISPEQETGKQVVLGYDNDCRPCLYLNPSKQNTKRSDRQLHHLVYMLERTIDLMPAGQETLALLISFSETSSGQGASLAQGKQTMSILQNHYPERLGRALVTNIPWWQNAFFKLITPFIDPLTRQKLKFNEPMSTHVPAEQLLQSRGGDVDFEYVHEIYWPAMNTLAAERRKQMEERWLSRGGNVGESEAFMKSGKESGEENGEESGGGVGGDLLEGANGEVKGGSEGDEVMGKGLGGVEEKMKGMRVAEEGIQVQ